jgi:hypothetical protein
MANDPKRKGGRVTPKGGASASSNGSGASPKGSGGKDEPVGQVGKRPSPPIFLLLIGFAWIICGVFALFLFKPSWRIVVGVVFIGIGLFWMRGAMATYARHDERLQDE